MVIGLAQSHRQELPGHVEHAVLFAGELLGVDVGDEASEHEVVHELPGTHNIVAIAPPAVHKALMRLMVARAGSLYMAKLHDGGAVPAGAGADFLRAAAVLWQPVSMARVRGPGTSATSDLATVAVAASDLLA